MSNIHLRSVLDGSGDTGDYDWYCSKYCYEKSLEDEPPSDTFEEGGAYPCGAESDSPEVCTSCNAPIGNPITDIGVELIEGWLAEAEPSQFARECALIYGIEGGAE